jgi:hypothetical protein
MNDWPRQIGEKHQRRDEAASLRAKAIIDGEHERSAACRVRWPMILAAIRALTEEYNTGFGLDVVVVVEGSDLEQRHAPIGGFRTLDPRNYGRRSRAPCPHARRRRFERKRALGCSEPYRREHRGVLGAGLDAAALAAGRPGHGNKKSEPDRGAAGPQLRLQVVESTNVLL